MSGAIPRKICQPLAIAVQSSFELASRISEFLYFRQDLSSGLHLRQGKLPKLEDRVQLELRNLKAFTKLTASSASISGKEMLQVSAVVAARDFIEANKIDPTRRIKAGSCDHQQILADAMHVRLTFSYPLPNLSNVWI